MWQEDIAIVRGIYEAYARRDVAAALACFAEEVEFVQTPLLPWGGHFRGLGEVQQGFYSELLAHLDSGVELEQVFSSGERVVAVGRTRGKVKTTGKPFDVPAVHLWTLKDGRITRFEAFIDTPAMLEALS